MGTLTQRLESLFLLVLMSATSAWTRHVHAHVSSPLSFLSSFSSASKLESHVSPQVAAIVPPPPDIQAVIDKLAEYVTRNGLKFEASVRAKNDPR